MHHKVHTITPRNNLFSFNLSELWEYKDLIYYLVKRDFISSYKQTILGPLWYVIQPLITSFVLFVVFNKIAKLPTGQIPPFLFYLSGNIIWKYFSDNLFKTADTFINNAGIFSKVYFPRLTVPISGILSGLISFFIQFLVFSLFIYIINPNLILI